MLLIVAFFRRTSGYRISFGESIVDTNHDIITEITFGRKVNRCNGFADLNYNTCSIDR